jgi:tetratricopeptide (TPR) repeat protein
VLTADAYLLRHDGELAYWVPRLVRGDLPWRFEGVTHEHLALDAGFTQERLLDLVVVHHADGGSRGDKLDRDRRLLERRLAEDPGDARATFYLAQTLRDLGDEDAAAELYRRRAAMGGWDEEVYYAAFQAGVLAGRRDVERGIAELRAAAEMRPSRGEALHELARLLRIAGRHEEARDAAARGAALPVPDDVLFVHRDVHHWGLRFEQAMAAHQAGRAAEALGVADALLDEGRLPPEAESALRESRASFSVTASADRDPPPAPLLATLARSFTAGRIALDVEPAWPAFNPSVAADGDGLRLVVRTANYRIRDDGSYAIEDDDGVVRTINYLLRLDAGLTVTDVAPIVEPDEAPTLHPSPVEGYEDLRLVALGGRWLATATTRDRDPAAMCRMALLDLGDADGPTRAMLLTGPDPERHEKNWMPFAAGPELRLVYSLGPTVVFACDPETGAVREIARAGAPAWAGALRGGSQGVEVPGGWLFAVHEVLVPAFPRRYAHRFVLLGPDHRLIRASQRFSFAGADIEMCVGLARRGDDLVVSYGVRDAEAWVGVLRADEALDLLRDLP